MEPQARDLLTPPRVRRGWYVGCRSSELGARPLLRRLFGQGVVLFRGASGRAGALVDRCPHRNVPLSGGQVVGDTLRCPYHGWRFEADGRCVEIPAFTGEADKAAHRCPSHPVVEQQGYVWVWGAPERPPTEEPFWFRYVDAPGYLVVHREVAARGSIHGVAENALDVPHTAFLHGGLFRNDAGRKPIRCVVKRWSDRVECEYIGETRPEGLVGRLLSPSGGLVTHFDRFFLPSVVEVEYRIGDENHIVVNAALVPEDDFVTRLYAVVALRTRLPGWLARPLITPVALRIFGQDQTILAQQSDTLAAFGEQRFVSTDIDLLGPHILKLLLRAERDGRVPDEGDPTIERETTLLV